MQNLVRKKSLISANGGALMLMAQFKLQHYVSRPLSAESKGTLYLLCTLVEKLDDHTKQQ